MLNGAFAMLSRALRVEDRLLRSHLFRLVFLGTIYFSLLSTQSMGIWFGAPGLRFFGSICYMNFIFITLAAVSFFATAITEEKEEMTLGLLRMAGINPVAILLGKSTPRMITAALLLSAQFPFTMLAITLGGVSLHQVLAAYLALLAYLILVANLGLFASVICQRSNGAGWLTGIVVAFLFFGPLVVNASIQGLIVTGKINANHWFTTSVTAVMDWMRNASVFERIRWIMQTGFSSSPLSHQVIFNTLGGIVLFISAWLAFIPCTRNEKPATPSRGLLTKRITGIGRIGPLRSWQLALAWKDFHFITGGKVMVVIKFLLYGFMFAFIAWVSERTNPSSFDIEDLGGLMMVGMLCALAIEIALYASRLFSSELKWKTLSNLMLLPKNVAEVAYAKLFGCAITLIPAVCYFFVGAILNPTSFFDVIGNLLSNADDFGGFLMTVSSYIFFVHLVALLSLFVKWGALPLAFALTYVMGAMFIPFFLMLVGPSNFNEGVIYLLAFMALFGAAAMHVGIGRRLKVLASQ